MVGGSFHLFVVLLALLLCKSFQLSSRLGSRIVYSTPNCFGVYFRQLDRLASCRSGGLFRLFLGIVEQPDLAARLRLCFCRSGFGYPIVLLAESGAIQTVDDVLDCRTKIVRRGKDIGEIQQIVPMLGRIRKSQHTSENLLDIHAR